MTAIDYNTAAGRRDDLSLTAVTVISFGYLHGAPPEAHAVFDVRRHFKDPHVDPELRELTGTYGAVFDAVMATPGIPGLVGAVAAAARAFLAGPQRGKVVIAVGCAGGRHRSVVIAGEVARELQDSDVTATVYDRDMHRPVIARP